METLLSSPFVRDIILPFLLVFVLIYALLEKLKILGEDKRQINAIIAFVIGLIFVSFSKSVGITVDLIGVVAVIAVVLLLFMMLYGFASGEKEFSIHKNVKYVLWILISIAIVIALLVITGYWSIIYNAVASGNIIVTNVIFLIVIIAAIAIVMWKGKD
ncbi:MAG: hypothetical protein NT076_00545 [Candidatus Pacearchaeota archaeon]|nr:hypothetical protein [Candidatus Pacearchaeota archaeon]